MHFFYTGGYEQRRHREMPTKRLRNVIARKREEVRFYVTVRLSQTLKHNVAE